MKARKSWNEKLADSKDLPRVQAIPDRMKANWGDGTLVIPAPKEVDEMMSSVPKGKVTTVNHIRVALAEKHKATIACPMTTGIFAWIASQSLRISRSNAARVFVVQRRYSILVMAQTIEAIKADFLPLSWYAWAASHQAFSPPNLKRSSTKLAPKRIGPGISCRVRARSADTRHLEPRPHSRAREDEHAMRRSAPFIPLLFLLAIAAQVLFAQTRPRRAEQTTPTPLPSPPTLIKPSEQEERTADAVPSTNRLPANNDTQEATDVIRINTTLVTLPVSVTDRLGRSIPDLQRQDFHIYEEGAEQEIAYFAAVEKPFTVVLMIDTSSSNWSKLGQIRTAAGIFVDQLRPDDQVMIVSFAGGLTIECEATTDRQKIRKGIEKTGKGLSTHLYDAMDKLMKKHLARVQGRKAVVLFTDGVDATSSHATYESTLRVAEELDALIYPIRYDTYDPAADKGGSNSRRTIFGIPLPGIGSSGGAGTTRADYAVGERYLRELAQLTGGRAYEASRDLSYLKDAFTHIAEELRRQYSIGYYPRQTAQAGERRRIKVRVSRPDLAVRTRDSYIFKGNADVTGAPSTTTAPEKRSSAPPVLQEKPLVSGT